jgi:hypothetical protein
MWLKKLLRKLTNVTPKRNNLNNSQVDFCPAFTVNIQILALALAIKAKALSTKVKSPHYLIELLIFSQ